MMVAPPNIRDGKNILDGIARAVAAYEALTPEQKIAHDYEQRRSFVRGMCPTNRDYILWCKTVDEILPPMRAKNPHKTMTPEEYATTKIKGWHEVYRDIDSAGNVGIRYLSGSTDG